jgi:hypothetical protein
MIAIWIHSGWPMDKIKVEIIQSETLQAHIEILRRAGIVCTPQLSCNKEVTSLTPGLFKVLLAYLVLPLLRCRKCMRSRYDDS